MEVSKEDPTTEDKIITKTNKIAKICTILLDLIRAMTACKIPEPLTAAIENSGQQNPGVKTRWC